MKSSKAIENCLNFDKLDHGLVCRQDSQVWSARDLKRQFKLESKVLESFRI